MWRIRAEKAKASAEAVFRTQHEHEAVKAATKQALEAERAAIAARTARLRDLRLAREAASRLAAKAAGLDEGNEPKRGPERRIKHAVVNGRLVRYTTKVGQVKVALTVKQQPNTMWLAQGNYKGQTVEAIAQSATAALKRWQELAEYRSGGPGHRRFASFLKPNGRP